MIIDRDESYILRINFYSGQETLVKVGNNDDYVKYFGGRVEIFEISGEERLIGCIINLSEPFLIGVTWIKMKVLQSEQPEMKMLKIGI